jgi:hypothetical protein
MCSHVSMLWHGNVIGGHVSSYLTRSLAYKALGRLDQAMADLEYILRELDQTSQLAHERLEAIKFGIFSPSTIIFLSPSVSY